MIVPLEEAVAGTCGGKAGSLGALLRAGLPVPVGFVVPFATYLTAVSEPDLGRPEEPGVARQAIESLPPPVTLPVTFPVTFPVTPSATLAEALARALEQLGDAPVAVRSSASDEDTGQTSAAGRYESFLAVHGPDQVADAVRACWASLFSPRAVHHRRSGEPMMAVIVQRHLDAEVSGVMFTPGGGAEGATEIEASWGLGPSVVGGTVTPDAYRVAADGSVTRTVAKKRTRLDRRGERLVTSEVPAHAQAAPVIDDATARHLATLGAEIAAVLGGPQDIEWAIADGHTWILQSRPVTAAPPPNPARTAPDPSPGRTKAVTTPQPGSPQPGSPQPGSPQPGSPHPAGPPQSDRTQATASSPARTQAAAPLPGPARTAATPPPPPPGLSRTPAKLTGTPGSHGTATGTARIVRGPRDFPRVRPGDILICPFTDPAWTPLLRIAAGVITETGGVLSHAAIVAREHAIPAVLDIPDATTRLHDDTLVTIDGTTGTVTTTSA
ncbi:hypothetical protein GCM10009850_042740 [Nonomuraea monospora]|uniref:Phosphoenolpyruvate synthase n=1 Tax=Nonomuraea monospora TaxID=568818 RepID=A0ABN3CHC4_9ACTN